MALVLVKEDGSGKADANSYTSVADCDAYFEGHLYATAWTAAPADRKAAALVMATRLIDSQVKFNGSRAGESQALQWPREQCGDPDAGASDSFVKASVVPAGVVQATCEMARELLIADRTAAPEGEGLDMVHTGHTSPAAAGAQGESENTTTTYSKGDTRPIISHVAQAMLSKFGAVVKSRAGVVPLARA
jgi:hypothetical protein